MEKPNQADVASRRAEASIEDIRNEKPDDGEKIVVPNDELMDFLRKAGLIK